MLHKVHARATLQNNATLYKVQIGYANFIKCMKLLLMSNHSPTDLPGCYSKALLFIMSSSLKYFLLSDSRILMFHEPNKTRKMSMRWEYLCCLTPLVQIFKHMAWFTSNCREVPSWWWDYTYVEFKVNTFRWVEPGDGNFSKHAVLYWGW